MLAHVFLNGRRGHEILFLVRCRLKQGVDGVFHRVVLLVCAVVLCDFLLVVVIEPVFCAVFNLIHGLCEHLLIVDAA